jgi:diaminopimelate epimerase
MRYINADGTEVEMCGNGGRAISYYFYHYISDRSKKLQFETMNGVYFSEILENDVRLEMSELKELGKKKIDHIFKSKNSLYLNTGVPHCVYETENIQDFDVFQTGREIRNNELFKNGTNVNFFEKIEQNKIFVRTYERGVEDETLSCGTGVTASAIAVARFFDWKNRVDVETKGGNLSVEFSDNFEKIFLGGGVNEVYSGSFSL